MGITLNKGQFQRSREFVDKLFESKQKRYEDIYHPVIGNSDDIGESALLKEVINIATDKTKDTDSITNEIATEIKFPFDRYTPFDHNKIDHDFNITSIHMSRRNVDLNLQKYDDILSLIEVIGDIELLIDRFNITNPEKALTDAITEIKIIANKYPSIISGAEVDRIINVIDSIHTSDLFTRETTNRKIIMTDGNIQNGMRFVPQILPNSCQSTCWTAVLKYYGWSPPSQAGNNEHTHPAIPSNWSDTYYIANKVSNNYTKENSISKNDPWNVPPELFAKYLFNTPAIEKTFTSSIIPPFTSYINRVDKNLLSIENLILKAYEGFPIITSIDTIYNNGQKTGNGHAIIIKKLLAFDSGFLIQDNSVYREDDGHVKLYYRKLDGSKFKIGEKLHNAVISKTDLFALSPDAYNNEFLCYTLIPIDRDRYRTKYDSITTSSAINNSTDIIRNSDIERLSRSLVSRIVKNAVADAEVVLHNNINGKVENLSVDQVPGACVYIPMEGMEAPVVQSIGGRNVQITVELTEVDLLNLSKLSLMFKVPNKEETLISMLHMSRSIYKSGRNYNRLKFVHSAVESDRFREVVKKLRGQVIPPRFDEPVRIKNDILNGLGLETFIPTGLEIKTNPRGAQSYNIILTFNYINLNYRLLESLKKAKRGTDAPILPIACRLEFDKESADSKQNNKDYNRPSNEITQFLGQMSRLSLRYGLSELIPIYILYKLEILYRELVTISNNGSQNIQMTDIKTIMRMQTDPDLWKEVGGVSEYRQKMNVSSAKIGEAIASGSAALSPLLIAGSSKLLAKGSKIKGVGGIVLGAIGVISSMTGIIMRTMYSIPEPVDKDRKGEKIKWLSFNLPTLIPMFIYEMISDFTKAHQKGEEELFLNNILIGANKILAIPIDEKTKEEDSLYDNTHERLVRFPNKIRITSPVIFENGETTEIKLTHELEGLHITNFVPGIHTIRDMVYGQYETGISSYKEEIKIKRKMLGEKMSRINLNTGTNNDINSLLDYAATSINLLAIETISNIDNMDNPLGRSTSEHPFTMYETAILHMYANDSAKNHALELIKGVITYSMLDIISAMMISSVGTGTNNNPVSDYINLINKNVNVKYPEGISEEEKILIDDFKNDLQTFCGQRINIIRQAQSDCVKFGDNKIEQLCGMFVDNSYTSSHIRTGFSEAMLFTISSVEQIAFGRVPYISQDVSVPDIMKSLHPTRWSILWDSVIDFTLVMFDAIVICALLTLISLVVSILSALSPILAIIGAIVQILYWGWLGLDIILQLIAPTVEYLIHKGNLFVLSHWLSERLRDAVDTSVFVEICYKTSIWSSYMLDFSSDAHDNRETSFIDYPKITIQGQTIPPDYYIYKSDSLSKTYDALKEQMNDMIQVIEDKHRDLDSNDFDQLLAELQMRLKGIEEDILDSTSAELSVTVSKWVYGADKYFYRNLNEKEIYDGTLATYTNISKYMIPTSFNIPHSDSIVNIHVVINNKTYFSSRSVSAINHLIDMYIYVNEGKVKLLPASDNINKFKKVLNNIGSQWQLLAVDNVAELSDKSINKEQIVTVRRIIIDLIKQLSSYNAGTLSAIGSSIPDTLSHLSLVRSLVGSSLKTVGSSGISLMKKQLNEVTKTELNKAARFSSGYIYPTIKLYFIEEDNENYYLFDDLYSYASILSCTVHMDRTSPIQTCMLQVSNIYGYLNNIVNDKINIDSYFSSAPDENSDINSMMLKPGCKIKIQAGNTPILDESNTIFTGIITNVNFDVITSIEARSHGDIFTEKITTENPVIYGRIEDITGKISSNIKGMFKDIGTYILGGSEYYRKPITKIRDIISHVLSDVVTTSTKLDNFVANPGIIAETDSELKVTANNLSTALYLRYMPERVSHVAKDIGADVSLFANKQLFENVNLGKVDYANDRWGGMTPANWDKGDGAWVSLNESAWEIMQEINMLLPNTVLTVRPYDVRGTLVWSEIDGFYRFQRSTDINSIVPCSIIRKLNEKLDQRQPQFKTLGSIIISALNSLDEFTQQSSIALLCLICYYARRMQVAITPFDERTGSDINLSTTDDIDFVEDSLRWFIEGEENNNPINTDEIVQKIKSYSKYIKGMYNSISDAAEEGKWKDNIGNISITDMSAMEFMTWVEHETTNINKRWTNIDRKRYVRKLYCLEMASEELIGYILKSSYFESSSHRRVSEFHVKTSGRDIVSNDIELIAPFNTVRMSYPPQEALPDDDDFFLPTTEKDDMSVIPLHHQLKMWNWNIYATHFKNANAFPKARTSCISMSVGSTLSNLMKETYGGTITLLGDPTIRENDRIVIWDENRDLYGIIGVREHTFIFNQTEGCLSVIVPDMQTRTEYNMSGSNIDSAFWWWNVLSNILMIGLVTTSMYKTIKQTGRIFKIKSAISSIGAAVSKGISPATKDTSSKFLSNTLGKGNIFSRIAKKTSEFMFKNDPIFSNPNKLNNLVRLCCHAEQRLHNTLTQDVQANTRISNYVKGLIRKIINNNKYTLDNKTIANIIETSYIEAKRKISLIPTGRTKKPISEFKELFTSGVQSKVEKFISSETNRAYTKNDITKLNTFLERNLPPKRGTANIESRLGNLQNRLFKVAKTGVSGNTVSIENSANIILERILFGNVSIGKTIGKSIFHIGTLSTINWGVESVRDIVDMWLINTETQDNVVLTPLFFRGEPFIAGVEGITKKEGERVGLVGIMTARFGDVLEAAHHSLTDDIAKAIATQAKQFQKGILIE